MPTFTVGTGRALEAAEYADFDTGHAIYRTTGMGTFTLASHLRAQSWAPGLRRAHEHHCAPNSLSRYGSLIAEYDHRMDRPRRDRTHYLARADRATAILQAGPVPPPPGAPPHPTTPADTDGR